jgi:hypothetical protein
LTKIQHSSELEILTIEPEDENQSTNYVVVVAARAERGQEALMLELLKKFEQNASKLKRSKSLENIFADMGVEEPEPSEDLSTSDSNRKPRRTLTWDTRKSYNSLTGTKNEGTELSDIPENGIKRYSSVGNNMPLPEEDEGVDEEVKPPKTEEVKPPKRRDLKKTKKMKKVKIFRPTNVITTSYNNNNTGTENPPVPTTTPEEEILIF